MDRGNGFRSGDFWTLHRCGVCRNGAGRISVPVCRQYGDAAIAKAPLVVVLIGVSGSGKSSVARLVAPSLGAVFLEGDRYHPSGNIAKMRAGTPLSDADRWPWLARLGHAIAEHAGRGRPVVATCSALRRSYRNALSREARHPLVFVHLSVDAVVLGSRLKARRQHFMPPSLLGSQLATLEPLGRDECGFMVAHAGTVPQTVERIRHGLRRGRHARSNRVPSGGRQTRSG